MVFKLLLALSLGSSVFQSVLSLSLSCPSVALVLFLFFIFCLLAFALFQSQVFPTSLTLVPEASHMGHVVFFPPLGLGLKGASAPVRLIAGRPRAYVVQWPS